MICLNKKKITFFHSRSLNTRYLILNTLYFVLYTFNSNASNINVRILSDLKLKSAIVSPLFGEYTVYADDKIIVKDTNSSSIFSLTVVADSIQLKSFEKTIGTFSKIKLIGKEYPNSFKIKSVSPAGKVKSFDDDLEITVLNQCLRLINRVDLEHYIGGVVQCESGTKTTSEYYRLQSILCRTYALSHFRRHETEGFNLCDQVHCQAYFNKTNDNDILNAVSDTKGLIVTDSELNLITAAFHSNCGGQTVNSEDLWALPTTYLKSVKDTFCLKQPNAHWQRKIATEDWMSYLSLKHKYPIEDSLSHNNALSFPQAGREIYFTDKNIKIPLKTIRTDWQLKSTYFSIEQKQDSVVFSGRGYGHGVGLCQEGAMQMSKSGYSYKEIIHFYYKDVHLIDLSELTFFREK